MGTSMTLLSPNSLMDLLHLLGDKGTGCLESPTEGIDGPTLPVAHLPSAHMPLAAVHSQGHT